MNVLCLALLTAGTMAAAGAEPPADPRDLRENVLADAILHEGDTARIERVLAKARAGEPIVVGTIGGSITAGASATTPENRWANRVAGWWRSTFPEASVELVNAGIGATGSDLACHRVRRDLLAHKPDFVVVEFAVNDSINPLLEETIEGLLRQILGAPNQPAVVMLFTMDNQGNNKGEQHLAVAKHYGVPVVSYRDAVWPCIEAGTLTWEDIAADSVHPNDLGHAYCGKLIGDFLEQVAETMPEDAAEQPIPPMPEPLHSDLFEHAEILGNKDIAPVRNEGWRQMEGGPGWEATEPGSVIEFEVEGTLIAILYHKNLADVGIATAQVDDRPAVEMDAYFPQDWGGGYTPYTLVARDLAPGPHTLRITLTDRRHEASNGHLFRVPAILTAGEGE